MAALTNDIFIGPRATPSYHFTNRAIALNSLTGVFGVDVIGNNLSVDTFSFSARHQFDVDMIYAPIGKSGYLDTNNKIYLVKKTGVAQYSYFVPDRSDRLVDINDRIFRVFDGYASDGYLMSLPFGTPVFWYVGGSFFRKGYVQKVERLARYAWKVTCISGIGLLDGKYHVGGLYNAETFTNICRDIIGGAFPFSIDSAVGATLIYGHLPYDTARNNLHRLLFAVGAAMVRGSANTDYTIRFLSDIVTNVPDSRIALGGAVAYNTPATRVEITEHAYFSISSDEEVKLFDNANGGTAVQNTLVIFKEPVHDLAVTGSLTISESGVNYAVISGVGTLTGKKYTHNESQVILGSNSADPNTKSVKDNHLISFANSNNVAQRILDYFSSAKRLKAKMILQGEKTGDCLSLHNAFGEASDAYLSKMQVNVTSVIGAQCELVEGFTPTGAGNNFTHREVITANGSWTVPSGTELIRIVLIGGGQGGSGGYDGEDGCWFAGGFSPSGAEEGEERGGMYGISNEFADREYGWDDLAYCFEAGVGYRNGEQREPQGGASGAPGAPGKYIVYDRQVQGGDNITINIGTGGAGGARNGVAGAEGGATTAQSSRFGTLTSADGVSSDTGYYDVLGEETFAQPGLDGWRGGNGGLSDTSSTYGTSGAAGRAGENVGTFTGGKGGKGKRTEIEVTYWKESESTTPETETFWQRTSGGGGGGAAYGANGSPGGDATIIAGHPFPDDPGYYWGTRYLSGIGGDGATALPPDQATNGNGGQGGNGGGGGGNLGGVLGFCGYNTAQRHIDLGGGDPSYGGTGYYQAKGGHGSVGGQGGNGVAIIYW